jgi:hypothetical protein
VFGPQILSGTSKGLPGKQMPNKSQNALLVLKIKETKERFILHFQSTLFIVRLKTVKPF